MSKVKIHYLNLSFVVLDSQRIGIFESFHTNYVILVGVLSKIDLCKLSFTYFAIQLVLSYRSTFNSIGFSISMGAMATAWSIGH